jgi:hypothetical protein
MTFSYDVFVKEVGKLNISISKTLLLFHGNHEIPFSVVR